MDNKENPTMEADLLESIAEKDRKIQILAEQLEITQAVVDEIALGGTV